MPKANTTIEKMTREQLIAEITTLKESHAKYKEVFDSMVDVFTRVNNDGYFEMVSPSMFNVFGYHAEDMLGEKAVDYYVDPCDRNRLVELINEQEFCENVQSRIYTKQGTIKVISVNAKSYKDDQGNRLGVECVIRDITEQKMTEEKLNENAILLNESQRLAHLGHWHWNIAENFLEWSPELHRIYGLDESDFKASFEGYLELLHPEDREGVKSIIDSIMKGSENQVHFEERIVRQNGEIRFLESWGTIVRKEDGTPLKMFGACLDITEKKLTEKKIIESKEQFQNLFEFAPDARFIHKEDTIVNVNNSFLKLYGYSSKDEIIGKSVTSSLIDPDENNQLDNWSLSNDPSAQGLVRASHIKNDRSSFITETQSSTIQYEGSTHYQVISRDITERNRMEAEIRLNTLLLKESEKIAHLGHMSWNLTGDAFKWSDEIYRICGVDFDVVPSIKHTLGIVHPDDLSLVRENLNLAMQQIKEYKLDHRVVRADNGKVVWVQAEVQLKFDSHGNLESFLGTLLDITEKKKDQTALLQSEEEFRSIYENTYSGIPLVDLNGKFLKANQRFVELLGYSEQELLDMTLAEVTHPDDLDETEEKLEALISGKISHFEVEKRYIKKSGAELICNTAVTAPIGINGLPEFLTANLTDITEEKRSQEILKAISEIQSTFIGEATVKEVFEKMLHSLLKITQSRLGIIGEVLEKDGQPVLITHAETILSVLDSSDGPVKDSCTSTFKRITTEILATGKPIIYSNTDKDSDSQCCDLANFMGLPFYSNNELIGMIGVANKKNGYNDDDLRLLQPFLATCSTLIAAYKNEIIRSTERQASERMKEAFTNELEIKVSERTEVLERTQKELSISLEKEKVLGELKSRFVSTASHQFRTPLTVIQSNMGILSMQKDLMDDTLKTTFEKANNRIVSQIRRMTTMMNDVLILGKIDAGSIVPDLEPIDLVELCKEIIDNYNEIQDDQRNMTLTIIGKSATLELDAGLITHAISNFVSNAFKYSKGRPAPSISLMFNKESIQVSIIDFGLGIPKEDLTNLFEPFYRASNVSEVSGTGLGTSIAKEYVELNMGSIEVKSTINEGTEFILTFKK